MLFVCFIRFNQSLKATNRGKTLSTSQNMTFSPKIKYRVTFQVICRLNIIKRTYHFFIQKNIPAIKLEKKKKTNSRAQLIASCYINENNTKKNACSNCNVYPIKPTLILKFLNYVPLTTKATIFWKVF